MIELELGHITPVGKGLHFQLSGGKPSVKAAHGAHDCHVACAGRRVSLEPSGILSG